jgi:asparagine synthase (glutamine-hydrolysing)
VTEREIGGMLAPIHHRGPDEDGRFVDGGVALGIRRLSIIDVSGGHQPIANEDGSVVVVCNGEIYNYRELSDGLRQRGHRFSTKSDVEVIVHLYEEHGAACVEHLRGMFGFAIWDARQHRLLVARDRLGIKPMYYTESDGRLLFGSEIKAILAAGGVRAELDHVALSHYLSLKYVPAPRTMFAGVASLPPGHLLVSDRDGVRVSQWWDLSFAPHAGPVRTEDEYAEELEALLTECVSMHLMSDVPFGAFLSGGVDSSLIVALMTELLDRPVKTFSIGFEGDGAGDSELPFARMVAERYGAEQHELLLGPSTLIEDAERLIWFLDQPIADPASIATLKLAELASQHVKMVLTGEGGDELFGGYARHSGDRLTPLVTRIPGPLKGAAVRLGGRVRGHERPKLALYALTRDSEAERLVNWFPLFNDELKADLVTDLVPDRNGGSTTGVMAAALAQTDARDRLGRMLYVDTKLWLPDLLLLRGDKTAMATSVEGRVPLLDHKLVEFAAGLPSNMKVHGMARKYLLKKVAARRLPEAIITRPKKGFPIPYATWFRGPARAWINDLLAPSTIRRRGLFEPQVVQRLLDEHQSGVASHANQLWGLVGVELWHRAFVDR